MGFGRSKGILLSALIAASLMTSALSLLLTSPVTAHPGPYEIIVRSKENAYTQDYDEGWPWLWYEAGDCPPVMAAKRVDNGAVVAAGFVASCRNGRWNDIDNPNPHLDDLLHHAFQWMVSGAENVLWYGETEDYMVYNDANCCSQLVDNLRLKFGYAIDNTIDGAFTPITPALLAPYEVLVIPQFELGDVGTGGNSNLLPDNVVETIENFVRAGGGLLIMEGCDTFGYNYCWVQDKVLRALDMNIYFQSDTVEDNINNWGGDYEITADVDNTTGIGSTYQNSTGKTVIGLYCVCSLVSEYRVSAWISPEHRDNFPGGILSFTVNVRNDGSYDDNYTLVVSENVWKAELSENQLEVAAYGAFASTTLTVTIPTDAPIGTEDKITVTVTSQTENAVSDDANCIARAVAIGLADAPWPKFRHDEQNTGRSPYVGAQDNALKWSYAVGCGGGPLYGAPSPAVGADGTIYMGSDDGRLYALNPDGTLKWSYATGGQIYSSPAIGANGAIYITGDGMPGRLYALDENGALRWTFDNVYSYSSPAIGPDGTIYVGSYYSYFASLSALHENGDLKWSFSTGLLRDAAIVSCPAIEPDGTIYFTVVDAFETIGRWFLGRGPYGWIYALDENGVLKWDRWEAGGSPAIGADGTIYVASENGLIALNPDNTLKWSYVMLLPYSSPAIGTDGTIFMGGNDTLYALNPDNTLKWSYATGGFIWSSPAVGAGTVYVGSNDNKLYAFSENGTLMWTYATGGEVYSSPAIGAGGTIYVGSNDGELYAIGQFAKFSLATLYEIGLDVHLWLENGSKLVVNFYTYMGDNQGDNLVWENVTPAHVVLLENIPHPLGKAVEKAELVLTDSGGATISTLSTFIVRKEHLEIRFTKIPGEWFLAPPADRITLELEFSAIPGKWFLAPS